MSGIKIKSADGEVFIVNKNMIKVSNLLNNMVDLCEDSKDDIIPLKDVSGPVLKKIIEWANHYEFNPPVYDPEIKQEILEWDSEFLKQIDPVTFFDLIRAANYIESKALLDVCSKYMAIAIKGKTKEEVWGMFKPAFEKFGHPMKDEFKKQVEVVEPES